MTTREHLADAHRKIAEGHVSDAKGFQALGKCFSKMEGDNAAEAAGACQRMSENHTGLAEYHTECAKGISATTTKAMTGDSLVPDRIQGIIREFPDLALVPRHGQPTLDKANVREEFKHLVEISDE